MLEIYANNTRLHLPDDIEIDLTFENPLFIQDRIPSTYSMSFALPATRENLQIVNNAKRIASPGLFTEMESRILFNSATISIGKLLLMETEKDLKFNFIGSQFPGLVKEKMSRLNFDKYDLPAGNRYTPDFASGWSLDYKNLIFGQATTNDKFAAAPVRMLDEKWEYTETSYGDYNALKMYANMWNVNDGDFIFKTGASPIHAAIFPQPYVYYLIESLLGDKLNSSFISNDAELKKLCMITSFHSMFTYNLMSFYRGVILDTPHDAPANYFYLSSYFNKYPFNDFLRNILKIFCCSLIPRPDGKWDIIHNKEILDGSDIEDWSAKLAGTPLAGMQKAQRYQYGYSAESSSDSQAVYPTVASIEALLSAGTVAGNYVVLSTGEIYEKKLKDENVPGVFEYERKKTGLGSLDNSEDDDRETFGMNSEVSPVKMRVDEYWWENANLTRYPWYVPEFSGDRFSIDAAPQVGFMRGFYNISTKQIETPESDYSDHYPLLTPYNKDPNGNSLGDYSLAWEGASGLITKFHTDMKAYIEKDRRTLKNLFRLTPLDLRNLDYKRKIYVRGKLFYIKKIETTIRKRGISLSRCELMEA
jgi:hypothetical protein